MALDLSLSEILAKLEARIASLREQAEMHARQEEHHREQRTLREAELQKALEQLGSFQAVAATAGELDLPDASPPPPREEDLGAHPTLPKMVARVVNDRPAGERFGARSVTQEVNQRFRKWLRRPADVPAVSTTLRRMCANRRIFQVRAGKANHEALYTREQPPRTSEKEAR
jgi:hypothetical protein